MTLALLVGLLLSLSPFAAAEAGDATAQALQQVREMAMRPVPTLPVPAGPREVWVPERRVWLPGLGVHAVVPGHWERVISETQASVPALTIFREADRAPVTLPPAERPPAEIRTGP
jgi:hypothetical protein